MAKLTRQDLYSLEKYAEIRADFRAMVIEHKKNRRLPLGDHAALYFEDALTMQYQMQEMLRIERIFEAAGIQDELDVYNALIPDGGNWKATFMVEYPTRPNGAAPWPAWSASRRPCGCGWKASIRSLPSPTRTWTALAPDKTASVHFLRFELTPEMVAAVKNGAGISAGVSHPAYQATLSPLPRTIRDSLAADLA
jgi:hypothetical protein